MLVRSCWVGGGVFLATVYALATGKPVGQHALNRRAGGGLDLRKGRMPGVGHLPAHAWPLSAI